jgi:hypothetical protein
VHASLTMALQPCLSTAEGDEAPHTNSWRVSQSAEVNRACAAVVALVSIAHHSTPDGCRCVVDEHEAPGVAVVCVAISEDRFGQS